MSRLLTLLRRRLGGVGPCYLDDYTTDMLAAYGTRQIVSSYTGALIKVRRDSDDAELDINANADGTLDTAALLAFVGAGSGYVTTRYDQIGTDHEAQATADQQPRIVTSGVVETINGRAGVLFPATTAANLVAPTARAQPFSILNVASVGTRTTANQFVMGSETSQRVDVIADGVTNNAWTIYAGAMLVGSAFSASTLTSLYTIFSSTSSLISVNGVSATGDASTKNPGGFRPGNYYSPAADYVSGGHNCERVLWNGAKTAYRAGVERLIGLYYGLAITPS